jgi:hypothetical protein
VPLAPVTTTLDIPLSLVGADDASGSGVADFDVWVSVDGSPFVIWLDHTTDSTPVYHGIDGHTYAFYSIARDNVGNVESPPVALDTSTLISSTLQIQSGALSINTAANTLSFHFVRDAAASIDAGDLLLINLTTGQIIPSAAMNVSYDVLTHIATFTFPGLSGGTLPDGNYRATMLASGIRDSVNGLPLDGDADGVPGGNFIFDFFRFTGDANHDRTVDIKDLYLVASNFGKTGKTFADGDFSYDGKVDAVDLGLLSSKWQQILTAVTPPSVAQANFNYQVGPPSVTFKSSDDIAGSVTADDLILLNLSTGQVVPAANVAVTYDGASNTATFTFPGYPSGILPDGNYSATLPLGCVSNTSGTPLGSPFQFTFFVLAGDATRDRRVDAADQAVLQNNLGNPAPTFGDGDFNYDGSVNNADQAILVAQFSRSLPDPTPPVVIAPSFRYLNISEAVSFKLSDNVSASLLPSDLILQNLTTGQVVATANIAVSYDAASNVATFTFPGYRNGVLPDGNYRATLPAGSISNAGGTSSDTDYNMDFFVLGGDANRDRKVDAADLGIFSANWQHSPRSFAQGDFNYDGFVDINDLQILAANFRKTLPLPVTPPASPIFAPPPSVPARPPMRTPTVVRATIAAIAPSTIAAASANSTCVTTSDATLPPSRESVFSRTPVRKSTMKEELLGAL